MSTDQNETRALFRRQQLGPAWRRRSTTPSRGILLFDQRFSSCTGTTIDS